MVTATTQFKINSPDVVSETIDGEAVIVSLSRGTYYSLDQVGVDIWDLIGKGFSADNILATIAQRFDGDAQLIENSAKDLIAQLQVEQLITAIEVSSAEEDFTQASVGPPSIKEKFVPPVLQKYSDMVDLLMLDPIHEVNETEGWPAKKEETAV